MAATRGQRDVGPSEPFAPPAATSGPAEPGRLAHDVVAEARAKGGLVIAADYDRALCARAADSGRDGVPLLVRGALVALAAVPATRLVVVSGRDATELEARVNVAGVVYAGCRGLQIRGAGLNTCHPAAARCRARVAELTRALGDRLAAGEGAHVEMVHVGVRVTLGRPDAERLAAIAACADELRREAAPDFRLWRADSAVELFPNVDWLDGADGAPIPPDWPIAANARAAVVFLGLTDDVAHGGRGRPAGARAIAVGAPGPGGGSWLADRPAAADFLACVAYDWSAEAGDRAKRDGTAAPNDDWSRP